LRVVILDPTTIPEVGRSNPAPLRISCSESTDSEPESRVDEALERAERGAAIGRDRGLRWGLPRALRALARAPWRASPGAPELLDEAEHVASVELESIRRTRETLAPIAS